MDKQKKILIISSIAILTLAALIGIRVVNMSTDQVSSKNNILNEAKDEVTQIVEDGIVDSTMQETEEDKDVLDYMEDVTEVSENNDENETAVNDSNLEEIYVFKDKYSVKEKETLNDIALKCLRINSLEENYIFKNHAKDLITKINDIKDPNMIMVGSELMIPTKKSFQGIITKGIAYEVQEGDTIYNIVKNKMAWCEDVEKATNILMTNNKLNKAEELKAGTIIYIPEEQDLQV